MPKEVLVLIWMALIGVITWLIVAYVPLPAPFPTVIVIVAVILAILMAFRGLGWSMGPPP